MAHESFEDSGVAEILNNYYISIKVDKEERPDIDSIYMSVCQALTGSGGWPTSIFMTPNQKPFFAGTYFPKESKYGMVGFKDLLLEINSQWKSNKNKLVESADNIINHLKKVGNVIGNDNDLIQQTVETLKKSFDNKYGGFGEAPKFPSPHNLMFLMDYYRYTKDQNSLNMVETTLLQMYKGGIFDHIGYGFSRYSTDKYFLVPHFEKMLYDNALLTISYCMAHDITGKSIYRDIAEKTVEYILREMTGTEGGFFSAQDADSEGIEGKYYVFTPTEIMTLLGKKVGKEFNKYFDITEHGNFEGYSIPNLLKNEILTEEFNQYLPEIYKYRKERAALHLDDKILTSWNSMMIVALTYLFRISNKEKYLQAAEKAESFISKKLCNDLTLFVSYREGNNGSNGFIDDYAYYIMALISLYESTLNKEYLNRAKEFCAQTVKIFWDKENYGFYLYGNENEQLVLKPKETYDGAVPSGNSIMAYNLVKLSFITKEKGINELAEKQMEFMSNRASAYPAGNTFYLLALALYENPLNQITVVLKDKADSKTIINKLGLNSNITVLEEPNDEFGLLNDKTTFYVCKGNSCLPPTNEV
ncbi:MAG: thioredoxin domain-containing protein [Aminipila sp.]